MPASRTVAEVRDALFTAFSALWASTTPVAWPNVDFDPDTQGGTQWIRVSLQHATGSLSSFGVPGDRSFRRTGIFAIQVFTPAGLGSDGSDALVQLVLDAVEGTTLAGVVLRETVPLEVGRDGSWWQVNVNSIFEYDIVL